LNQITTKPSALSLGRTARAEGTQRHDAENFPGGVPKIFALCLCIFVVINISCLNPFAPGYDTSPVESTCDPSTIEGLFRCFQNSYTFRDTTVYGQLLADGFVFIYRNYDLGIDVTWGRDDDMRTTFGLFQNAQKLDLIWNNIVSTSVDSTRVNPSDIERVDGYANLTLERSRITDPWKIIRWRDESNF
jgi:hypothetical protein